VETGAIEKRDSMVRTKAPEFVVLALNFSGNRSKSPALKIALWTGATTVRCYYFSPPNRSMM